MNDIELMFLRKAQEQARREKLIAEHQLNHRKQRRAFWKTVRQGGIEILSIGTLIALVISCSGKELIAPVIAYPVALTLLVFGVWRAARYWEVLSR